MDRDIAIRAVHPHALDEVAACQRIFVDGQRLHGNSLLYALMALQTDMADLDWHYVSAPRSGFWVAVQGDRVVGTAALRPLEVGDSHLYSRLKKLPADQRPFDPDTCAEINRMCVDASMHRCGIGRRLLHTMVQFCRAAGYTTMHLSTLRHMTSAVGLYQSFGFRGYRCVRISADERALEAHMRELEEVHAAASVAPSSSAATSSSASSPSDSSLSNPCKQLLDELKRELHMNAAASSTPAAATLTPAPTAHDIESASQSLGLPVADVRALLDPAQPVVGEWPSIAAAQWVKQYGIYHVVFFTYDLHVRSA